MLQKFLAGQRLQCLCKQRNETNAKIRQAQKNYEEKLINNFKKEPKKFYRYLRSKQVKVTVTQLATPALAQVWAVWSKPLET